VSLENVELVRSFLPDDVDLVEVIRSEDPIVAFIGTPTGAVAPGVEVVFEATSAGGPAPSYRGLEGLVEGWREWLTPWDSYHIHFEDFIDAGDDVVVPATVTARTERHGVEFEHRPSSVWRVRDGTVVAIHFFLERAEALKFAGIDN
jgi:ketosteroid isomerase-like protein